MPYFHISQLVEVSSIDTGLIALYEERTAKLKADVPQLEAIIAKTLGKEYELKQIISELAALDRKITAELPPKHDENDGTENKQEQSQHPQTEAKETTVKSANVNHLHESKPTMVAEPMQCYQPFTRKQLFRNLY